MRVFPDSDVSIVDSAADGRLLVVAQSSDVVPATYYLLTERLNSSDTLPLSDHGLMRGSHLQLRCSLLTLEMVWKSLRC